MLFNSFEFAVFFVLCLALYRPMGRVAQNRLLLVASYVFYGSWDWRFLFLLAASTAVDYVVGLRLAATEDPRRRRRLLGTSLVVNLGILGTFKYLGFFADSLRALLEPLGVRLPPLVFDVVLPVGISFYTFQTLSYTIDVYRRRIAPTRSVIDFALFVAFFPQLVAGPIERASHLLPQMARPRHCTREEFRSGGWLVFWGLFKKVVIADNLAPLVDVVYAPGAAPTGAQLLFATYAFAYQIYCDFSGYTDIARGVARMMGFDIMLNFNLPYAALSPADFWHRWHISLSTWLRDYLYIPLGGNRHGRYRTYRNLAITMLLGGLWHGAAWPFVLWGAYHGALLIAQRALEPMLAGYEGLTGPVGRAVRDALRVVATFHLVCLGWMVFRCETLAQLGAMLGVIVGPFELAGVRPWVLPFVVLTLPLLLVQTAQWRARDLEVVLRWPLAARSGLYVLLSLMLIVLGEDGGAPFIYFQF